MFTCRNENLYFIIEAIMTYKSGFSMTLFTAVGAQHSIKLFMKLYRHKTIRGIISHIHPQRLLQYWIKIIAPNKTQPKYKLCHGTTIQFLEGKKKQSSLDISFIRDLKMSLILHFSYEMFVFFIKVQTSYTLVSAV